MTHRTLAVWLAGIILLLLAATAIGQKLLFDFRDRNFTADVKDAMARADAGDWTGAQVSADQAATLWKQGNFLVAVKYAESDYTLLNLCLARFRASIARKDASGARTEGVSCLYLFENITSISPQP